MDAVFISYAREDKDFVQKLQTTLTAAGRESWVDLDDLYAERNSGHGFAPLLKQQKPSSS